MKRAYRYRLYPTARQAAALDSQLVAACDLYNSALEQRRWLWREHKVAVGYREQSAELRELRASGLVPREANFWSQQEVLRRLDRAFQAFFRRLRTGKRPGYPRFKAPSRFNTLAWSFAGNAGGVAIRGARLYLQGVGCVKVKWHRPLPERAELREVRVTRRVGDRFYAIFQIGLPEPETQWRPAPTVGIDVGVRTFARLSNGEPIEGPCAGKAAMAKTRRLQRSLARKRKGSRRRAKAVALLARHREREQARRINEAHRESRKLVDRFGVIAVEELVVGNLVRSARGTVDDPGMNVSAKRALNRSITDQAWSRFVFMLAYKAEEAGGRVVRVAPKGTSQTCAVCGACDRRSRPGGGSRFRCTGCGHAGDADTNAARVILHRAREKMKSEQHQGPGRGLQAQTPALAGVA